MEGNNFCKQGKHIISKLTFVPLSCLQIGNSTSGIVEAPLWSYKLGLENGWIPTDPRESVGKCASLGISGPIFNGTYESWQTGGADAGTIAASATAQFGVYPPATISNVPVADVSLLPTYTSTGIVATLPPPSMTASVTASISGSLDGWFDAQDTGSAPTAVVGCTYPDPWNGVQATVPTAVCTGA